MTGLNIESAIFAAAGSNGIKQRAAAIGLLSVKEWLDRMGVFDTQERLASMIGQCAHESAGFTVAEERLFYSAKRLMEVWPRRFPTMENANRYARNPKALANRVYNGRMGNSQPGDGWRYRGRGWLQLTGRANYRRRGRALGIDLEGNPDLATKPGTRWKIAASYLATRKRAGRTAFAWADAGDHRAVTLIINGGLHGLADRTRRTVLARAALTGG